MDVNNPTRILNKLKTLNRQKEQIVAEHNRQMILLEKEVTILVEALERAVNGCPPNSEPLIISPPLVETNIIPASKQCAYTKSKIACTVHLPITNKSNFCIEHQKELTDKKAQRDATRPPAQPSTLPPDPAENQSPWALPSKPFVPRSQR